MYVDAIVGYVAYVGYRIVDPAPPWLFSTVTPPDGVIPAVVPHTSPI